MPHVITNTLINIGTYPPPQERREPSTTDVYEEFTIGDLHGNSLYFINFLIRSGIVDFTGDESVKAEKYATLADYYTSLRSLRQNNIRYNARIDLITDLIAELEIKDKNALVRLIGDEVADRGENDYLNLKILEKLKTDGANCEILLSNHGTEFIRAYETQNQHPESPFMFTGIRAHASSMINMQHLINSGHVSLTEINRLIENFYRPLIKVLSYTLSEDESHIQIHSHAGIDFNIINNLAEKLGLSERLSSTVNPTPREIANLIDLINKDFDENYLQQQSVNTLTHTDNARFGSGEDADPNDPFYFICWSRNYDAIHRTKSSQYSYVHGHDSNDPEADNIHTFDLNNELGRPSVLKGTLRILHYSSNDQQFVKKRNPFIKAAVAFGIGAVVGTALAAGVIYGLPILVGLGLPLAGVAAGALAIGKMLGIPLAITLAASVTGLAASIGTTLVSVFFGTSKKNAETKPKSLIVENTDIVNPSANNENTNSRDTKFIQKTVSKVASEKSTEKDSLLEVELDENDKRDALLLDDLGLSKITQGTNRYAYFAKKSKESARPGEPQENKENHNKPKK